MKLNPSAIVFWAIATAIGWLINGTTGAIIGFAATASLSWLLILLP